jgi:hypothetical protein
VSPLGKPSLKETFQKTDSQLKVFIDVQVDAAVTFHRRELALPKLAAQL